MQYVPVQRAHATHTLARNLHDIPHLPVYIPAYPVHHNNAHNRGCAQVPDRQCCKHGQTSMMFVEQVKMCARTGAAESVPISLQH